MGRTKRLTIGLWACVVLMVANLGAWALGVITDAQMGAITNLLSWVALVLTLADWRQTSQVQDRQGGEA